MNQLQFYFPSHSSVRLYTISRHLCTLPFGFTRVTGILPLLTMFEPLMIAFERQSGPDNPLVTLIFYLIATQTCCTLEVRDFILILTNAFVNQCIC